MAVHVCAVGRHAIMLIIATQRPHDLARHGKTFQVTAINICTILA